MSPDPAFEALIGGLRRGEAGAAEEIFRRFAHRLIGLARRRLDAKVRQKVDPEDVAQSALKSFFRRHAEGQYDLESWDGLWSLLALITLRKCNGRARHFRTARRDVGHEVLPPADEACAGWEALAREPTPSEAAVLAETVEGLFRGQDETGCAIIGLALQGYTAPEISARVGRSERTVYRLLERIREWLEHSSDDDTDEL